MIWQLRFDPAVDTDLRVVSYDLATAACEAVHRFAQHGEGRAYPVDVDASVWKIFVPGGYALVRVNLETDTLDCLRVVPSDPTARGAPQLLDVPDADES